VERRADIVATQRATVAGPEREDAEQSTSQPPGGVIAVLGVVLLRRGRVLQVLLVLQRAGAQIRAQAASMVAVG
ncbi:MAG: hypothetical protein LC777_16415, partial [Actinobacteria bacterium]|nr:hypothetical protein [Actinomycetota bacterium]